MGSSPGVSDFFCMKFTFSLAFVLASGKRQRVCTQWEEVADTVLTLEL